jgi:hypothetical protein
VLFLIATPVYAANTTGNAWSESLGWFDFSNATVSDSGLSGYAYNDNTGWLVLDDVSNSSGTLSGYAWSESVGYFSFDNVSISTSDGSFSGYAYNDNTGWLSFEDDTNVTTTWTETTATESTTSYGYYLPAIRQQKQQVQVPVQTTDNTPTPTNSSARDLETGDRGTDVQALQILLNYLGYQLANEGPGSPGNETDFFGALTRGAVIRYQQENNITPAIGYFGPITRASIIQDLLSKFLTEVN